MGTGKYLREAEEIVKKQQKAERKFLKLLEKFNPHKPEESFNCRSTVRIIFKGSSETKKARISRLFLEDSLQVHLKAGEN